jgi:hypothetical protein
MIARLALASLDGTAILETVNEVVSLMRLLPPPVCSSVALSSGVVAVAGVARANVVNVSTTGAPMSGLTLSRYWVAGSSGAAGMTESPLCCRHTAVVSVAGK